MAETLDEELMRKVRIHTRHGIVDGSLRISPMLRTLDELNMGSRNFLTVHHPDLSGTGWKFSSTELSLNRSSILFIYELGAPPRSSGKKVGGTFSRATVRLSLSEYSVEGFLHIPPGGNALKRLNQLNHPFLSLTSVSVVGPDSQFATPFLAINHSQIVAAEQVVESQDDAPDREPAMSFELT